MVRLFAGVPDGGTRVARQPVDKDC